MLLLMLMVLTDGVMLITMIAIAELDGSDCNVSIGL